MSDRHTPFGVSFGFRVEMAMIAVLAALSCGLALEMCLWALRMSSRDLLIGFGLLLFLGFQIRQRVRVIRNCREAEAIRER
jgi:hypothetical protein